MSSITLKSFFYWCMYLHLGLNPVTQKVTVQRPAYPDPGPLPCILRPTRISWGNRCLQVLQGIQQNYQILVIFSKVLFIDNYGIKYWLVSRSFFQKSGPTALFFFALRGSGNHIYGVNICSLYYTNKLFLE